MCARQIQTRHQSVYAGSRFKPTMCEKVLPYMPAFQPYRGKPAVRNDREGRGNVGIIRSPVRASTLPDGGGRAVKRASLPLRNRREFITPLGGAAAWQGPLKQGLVDSAVNFAVLHNAVSSPRRCGTFD